MPQPFTAIIQADAFDVSGLPPHARQPGTTGSSYMYAIFQQFMPGVGVGIDLSKGYATITDE